MSAPNRQRGDGPMMGRVTVFDIAAACLDRQAGSSDRAKCRFLGNAAKREALRRECLIGSLALDVCEEMFAEAVRDGVDDDVELMLETRRRAREPEALERLRQRLKRALN